MKSPNLIQSFTLLVVFSWLDLPAAMNSGFSPICTEEVFFTSRNHDENVDSMATWKGPDGMSWLITTCKAMHDLRLEKATNGKHIRRIGGLGSMPGQFNRPNGISVVDDLLLVVERDNRRVQVLTLPGLQTLTSFGESELRAPYGIYIRKTGVGEYTVYVTDSYQGPDEAQPADSELNERIKVYELEVEGTPPQTAKGKLVQTFGATRGAGRLLVVESIYGDPQHNRLMIAEEEMEGGQQCIKVYSMDGQFTGQTLGKGFFHGQPEGIALYACEDGSGYWIFTDQGKSENYFHLFDRISLEYRGTFYGPGTLNTDGIWLATNLATSRYPMGLFYALHNDGNVAAFDWAEILKVLALPACP